MKTHYALLSAVLTIALTLPMVGQDIHNDSTKNTLKQPDRSSLLGKPTADATVEGLHMKVWLMTQEQHKEMMKGTVTQTTIPDAKEGEIGRMDMKGIKDSSLGTANDVKGTIQGGRSPDKTMVDAMAAGTHHIRLDLTDAVGSKDISNASAKILIVSPSDKKSSVDLTPMMSHFGGALTLDEKGEYRFTVDVNVGGVSKTTQFQYAVK
jgi:hypothetical protein